MDNNVNRNVCLKPLKQPRQSNKQLNDLLWINNVVILST